MSVFQLKDWWSASSSISAGEAEEVDLGAMALGNVDNAIPASRILRVFAPTKANYRVEDLVHEEYLGAPILQVAVGRFLPASPDYIGIAVLHPRKLYNQAGKAVYFSLSKAYEHNLGVDGKHFTAYNMVVGPFGGVVGKDLILVQSMSGTLQVFEQTASAFTRQLSDCLLPAPLLYMRRMDAFVIANYTCRVECYRYQVLVNAQNDIGASSNGEGALHNTRTAVVEWSLNLGETCLQLAEGKFLGAEKRASDEILALTERSLVLIKESGVIIQQRRLDKEPACMCAYAAAPGMGHNFVVAYRDGTLQVYSDFSLVWAVTAEVSPVQIAVADFGSQKGLITCLDGTGKILVGFLGTRPPVTAIGGYKRELDYDKVDEEHRQLLQVIRESQSETKTEPRDMLIMRSQMSKTLDTRPLDRHDIGDDLGKPPSDCAVMSSGGAAGHDVFVRTTLRLFVSYSSPRPATNINVVINTPSFVHAVPASVVISQLSGNQSTPTIIHVTLYASKTQLPTSLDAQAVATYVAANGEPRVAVHPIQLPLFLACRLRPAAKNNVYKLTLESTTSHPLSDLFTDFLAAAQDAGSDVAEVLDASGGLAIGFQFWCHAADTASKKTATDATAANALYQQCSASIIMAKSGGKYRVQSDMLAVLHVLVSELSRRVTLRTRETNSNSKQQPHRFNALAYLDSIPLDPYFSVISEHFNTRVKLQGYLSQLNDQSHQFRVIEKRLLTRFKDKNPSPLTGLDSLLRETYQSVLRLADAVEEQQHNLRMLFAELECQSRLMALLATLRYDMNPMEHQALESYLCPNMSECEELGWEEVVEASVTYLLKTTLAKNTKEYAPVQQSIVMPDDTDKLTKHINMVFDRIAKGGKLIKLKSSNTTQRDSLTDKSKQGKK